MDLIRIRAIFACCALPILASCDLSSTFCDLDDLNYECARLHETYKQRTFKVEAEKREVLTKEGKKVEITTIHGLVGAIAGVKESPDGSIFLVGGQASIIARQKSGTNDWTATLLTSSPNFIRDITFLNDKKAFAVGDKGMIYSTEDGGENWALYNPGFISESSSDLEDLKFRAAYTVAFADNDFGVVAGEQRALTTIDGGQTWQRSIDSMSGNAIQRIILKKNRTGWAVTSNGLLYTPDSGKTWYAQDSPLREPVPSLALDHVEPGLLCYTVSYSVLCSDQPGPFRQARVAWKNESGSGVGITNLKMHDKKRGWFTTESGNIYITEDGGHNWHIWMDVLANLQEGLPKNVALQIELWGMDVGVERVFASGGMTKFEDREDGRHIHSMPILLSWKKSDF